jgi:hypothetical protein
MVGSVGAGRVEPVVNPIMQKTERLRLYRMAVAETVGKVGPVRQTGFRDQVVSPLALEQNCGVLLQRAQRAIATIVTSGIYSGDLRDTLQEPILRQHEWEIAVALREITELMLDLVSSHTTRTAGPMTNAVMAPQKRAILIARDATRDRVRALESLAAQVAAAEAARLDWETAHRLAADNDKYLDLVARTAADQLAAVEITGLATQAAQAAQALRETLQQATLAAQALALPNRKSERLFNTVPASSLKD